MTHPEIIRYHDRHIDILTYLLLNLPVLAFTFPFAREVYQDLKAKKPRSISQDANRLNQLFGIEVHTSGEDNIPPEGPIILAISHAISTPFFPGWHDRSVNPFWWLAGVCNALKDTRSSFTEPRILAIDPSDTHPMVRKLVQQAFVTYNGYPVDQLHPRQALQNLRRAANNISQSNDVYVISPEGESWTGLTRMKRGIVQLTQPNIPTIPCAYFEEPDQNRYKHCVSFGAPLLLNPPNKYEQLPYQDRKRIDQDIADRIGYALAELLPNHMKGQYANPPD